MKNEYHITLEIGVLCRAVDEHQAARIASALASLVEIPNVIMHEITEAWPKKVRELEDEQ